MAGLRIADRWFERATLADGVTWLWEPHVHPLLRCNIWHVRGRDTDLLVDTGLGIAPLREELANLIDKPITAVATHFHYDHVGGLHEFENRVIHRAEAPEMDPYSDFATLLLEQFPDDAREVCERAGYRLDEPTLIDARPSESFDPATFSVVSARPTREVDEGEIIDLGDRRFEVLHLPGHSPGSIGLWEQATGILFSGDAIYDGPLLDEFPDSDIALYVGTMKRLRDIPVTVVHAGHEASFGRERMHELAQAYLDRRGA